MEVDGFTSTLTLQLDFDKSLKTPKVPAQDAYYSARVRTHLLGIYCANDGKIYCFFYDETSCTTAPKDVISVLDYLIQRLQKKLGRHDDLMIGLTMLWDNSRNVFFSFIWTTLLG